jgi:lipopolysaccharide/colanic/teichoic acid biosynthesis glycosyltransferase
MRGDMSLVGPDPVAPDVFPKYGRHAWAYCAARPGMTGLWWLGGRNRAGFRARAARDRHYAGNWSLGLDVVLLLKAVAASMRLDRAA